jgi:hypothetical protein
MLRGSATHTRPYLLTAFNTMLTIGRRGRSDHNAPLGETAEMIKATADIRDGRKLVVFGLSAENVALLMVDKPIEFNGADIGLPNIDFFIFAGASDNAMTEEFQRNFAIGNFIDRRGE